MLKRILKWIGLGFLAIILIAAIVYAFLLKGPRDLMEYTDLTKTEKQLLKADEFAIVAGTPWATQAGYDVLARGGNACEAAMPYVNQDPNIRLLFWLGKSSCYLRMQLCNYNTTTLKRQPFRFNSKSPTLKLRGAVDFYRVPLSDLLGRIVSNILEPI